METDKKPQKNEQQNEKRKSPINALARYSGMAFQIGGAVILGVLVGKWMDNEFDTSKHIFTAMFSILGVFIGLYAVIKDVLKK